MKGARRFSTGRIDPSPITGQEALADLIDNAFTAYNASRLREGCQLLARKVLQPEVTVGLTLTGALTPGGYGKSCLVPLIERGLVDWIVSTGANLYHDTHHAIGLKLHSSTPFADDIELQEQGVVRIYDIVFDYDVLLRTDLLYRQLLRLPEFHTTLSTPEMHYRLGRYIAEIEDKLGLTGTSLMAAAYRHAVPIFTSSPGDSSIGLNVAEMSLEGQRITFDVNYDVNYSAAIVWDAKVNGGRSAVWMLGGGSPKNFALQTEPQIQEVLGIEEAGHDYFFQITDARPDTGGLSGATPGEAVSWGKVDPDRLPDAVVLYCDATIALPLITHYLLGRDLSREPKRLYERRHELMAGLQQAFEENLENRRAEGLFDLDRLAP
ncbi:MAG TPA: deoxyhypusine synthase [Thermoanaerobaculia bacterium]|nr:deoxyhypusine synthase [Thermoanaerobaculia bacterium]